MSVARKKTSERERQAGRNRQAAATDGTMPNISFHNSLPTLVRVHYIRSRQQWKKFQDPMIGMAVCGMTAAMVGFTVEVILPIRQ